MDFGPSEIRVRSIETCGLAPETDHDKSGTDEVTALVSKSSTLVDKVNIYRTFYESLWQTWGEDSKRAEEVTDGR